MATDHMLRTATKIIPVWGDHHHVSPKPSVGRTVRRASVFDVGKMGCLTHRGLLLREGEGSLSVGLRSLACLIRAVGREAFKTAISVTTRLWEVAKTAAPSLKNL